MNVCRVVCCQVQVSASS